MRILLLQFSYLMEHERIGVRHTISEIDITVLSTELKRKGKTTLHNRILILLVIPELFIPKLNLHPILLPFHPRRPKTVRLHSFIIQQPTLLKIYQIKPHPLLVTKISHFEIKPSSMALRITIHTHQ